MPILDVREHLAIKSCCSKADSYPVYCVFLMGWIMTFKQRDIESVNMG